MTEQLKAIQKTVGVTPDGVYGPTTERAIAVELGCLLEYGLKDPGAFFSGVRKVTGALSQVQVDAVNLMLQKASAWPLGWVAYLLATAWHEARFIPQPEIGKGAGKPYGVPLPKYNNQVAYGRGLVQLTWDYNYEKADKDLILKGALLKNFDLALDLELAAAIIVEGMGEGWFTGKKMKDYISEQGTHNEFVNARRIVNGTDRAEMIADYADEFKLAFISGGWGQVSGKP